MRTTGPQASSAGRCTRHETEFLPESRMCRNFRRPSLPDTHLRAIADPTENRSGGSRDGNQQRTGGGRHATEQAQLRAPHFTLAFVRRRLAQRLPSTTRRDRRAAVQDRPRGLPTRISGCFAEHVPSWKRLHHPPDSDHCGRHTVFLTLSNAASAKKP
jgi:hypothetical protein